MEPAGMGKGKTLRMARFVSDSSADKMSFVPIWAGSSIEQK
jgi:hypothetical protein